MIMIILLIPYDSLYWQDLKPDVVTYTTLMKALIRVDKFNKVSVHYILPILSYIMLLLYSIKSCYWHRENVLHK